MEAHEAAPAEMVHPEEPEFSSVTIILDHLLAHDPAQKVVVKTVWSTETAHESLISQSAYFDSKNGGGLNLADPDTFRAVAQLLDADGAYVYVVNETQTNVIMDAKLWSETIDSPMLGKGTVLGAISSVVILATEMQRTAREAGIDTRLFVYRPDMDTREALKAA